MTDRLSDESLERIEVRASRRAEYDPLISQAAVEAREVLALVAEVRAAREREAASIGTGQIATLAIEDGEVFVWQEFLSADVARAAVEEGDFVVRRTVGPWEPVTEGDDDDQ